MPRSRYKRRGPPGRAAWRRGRRLRRLTLAAAAVLVVAVVGAVLAGGWRLWFAPSGEAASLEACADPRCPVQIGVAVDGRPLVEPMTFIQRADSAAEIDFVFLGLPAAPEEFRLLLPQDQRWLVAEGTLRHPETWSTAMGGGPPWVTGWDRAGNGGGTLRRWWNPDPDSPWIHTLSAPRALQPPSGGYVAGADALVTVTTDTPVGTYVLTIEAIGSVDGRSVTARAQLAVSVGAGN